QFRRGTRGARCGDINCLRLRQRIGGRLHLVDDVGRVVKGVDGVVDRQAVFAIAQQPGERSTGRTPGFRPAFGVERYRDLDRVRLWQRREIGRHLEVDRDRDAGTARVVTLATADEPERVPQRGLRILDT